MTQVTSLRLRLLIAAALAIALALAASGLLLVRLFSQHVEHRVAAELLNHLNQIAAGLEVGTDRTLQNTAILADPRFAEPYDGLYWQMDQRDGARLRSRSLWDFELTLPADELGNETIHRHAIAGPGRTTLVAVERRLSVGTAPNIVSVRLAVAADRSEIEGATADFSTVLWKSILVIGVALCAAFAAMLHIGLLPLRALGEAIQRVHAGASPTVVGHYPSEVQALVLDVNRLLDKERETITRARERASDLAHGFKTPLAVLGAVARDLRRDGRATPANEIELQIDLMGRHVSRELARARMVGASVGVGSGAPVMPVVEKVVVTLRRIDRERKIEWSVNGDAGIRFAGDETDLLELVGNICENAGKWATSMIRIGVERQGRKVTNGDRG